MSDRELWEYVADRLESAATDLQYGDVESAGYELDNLSIAINEHLDADTNRGGDAV